MMNEAKPTPTGPYSPAVVAGGFIFVSGQRPVDPKSREIPDGIRDQTLQVGRNIATLLESMGSRLTDVVKVTAHLADLEMFNEFNDAYVEIFAPPYPARTTVGSQLRGILVELDVIAVQSSS
jgi:2-iminobutanoate/2-iminopropanoate deaminase